LQILHCAVKLAQWFRGFLRRVWKV